MPRMPPHLFGWPKLREKLQNPLSYPQPLWSWFACIKLPSIFRQSHIPSVVISVISHRIPDVKILVPACSSIFSHCIPLFLTLNYGFLDLVRFSKSIQLWFYDSQYYSIRPKNIFPCPSNMCIWVKTYGTHNQGRLASIYKLSWCFQLFLLRLWPFFSSNLNNYHSHHISTMFPRCSNIVPAIFQ